MTDVNVDFVLENDEPIRADFDVEQGNTLVADLIVQGSNDHNVLINRGMDNQHPISAITDLQDTLDTLHGEIGELDHTIGTYGDIVTHNTDEFATAEQGALADTALQPGDNISELVNDSHYATETYVDNGLSAKQDVISDLSTIREGASLGATAVQRVETGNSNGAIRVDGRDVAVKGLESAAYTSASDYATSAQGALADTALQPNDNISELNNNVGYITSDSLPTNYVTTDTNQTIGGTKTFSNSLYMSASSGGLYAGYNNSSIFEYSQFSETFGNILRTLTFTGYGEHPSYSDPYGTTTDIALISDIPTNVSQLNNDSGYITSASIPTNYVTTDTSQTIGVSKAFSQPLIVADNVGLASGTILTNYKILQKTSSGITLGNANNDVLLVGKSTTARPKYNSNDLALYSDVTAIEDLIPSSASSSNQLADKNFVNDQVSTNTAYFDGSWATYADIPSTVAGFTNENLPEPTNNNYLVVLEDETQDGGTWRYKYVDDGGAYDKANWSVEYEVNETPFTQAQLDAINSGVTSSDVSLAQSALQSGDNISTLVNDSGYITSSSLPTVNDATLTIQKNGTTVNTFTANASSNVTANITVPTDTTDLTNGAGYITGITSGDVTTALGYTPYNSTNPSGYISGITSSDVTTALGYTPYSDANPNGYTTNVGTVTSVNNTSPDGSGNVSLTIPSYSSFTGADGVNAGSSGLVPAPSATDNTKFLKGDGTWSTVSASVAWGGITGTLSNQTDLNNALAGKADDNAVVHLAGAETISGVKTFTSTNKFQNAQALQNTSVTKGTAPSSAQYTSITFCDQNGTGFSANQLGNIQHVAGTDGSSGVQMSAIKSASGSTSSAKIGVYYPSSGSAYTYAPTPSVSSNDTNIATTAYVNNKFQVVASLPVSPDANTFYFIEES